MTVILNIIDVLSRYNEFIDYKIQTDELKKTILTSLNYLLIRYCKIVSNNILIGQYPITKVGFYVGATLGKYSPNTNVTLFIPNQFNTKISSKSIYYTMSDTKLCIGSIHPRVYYEFISNLNSPAIPIVIQSNKINTSLSSLTNNININDINNINNINDYSYIQTTVAINERIEYGIKTNSSILKLNCNGELNHTFICPNNIKYNINCLNKTGPIQIKCPTTNIKPSCVLINIDDISIDDRKCQVLNSTKNIVTCLCQFNFNEFTNQSNESLYQLWRGRRRRRVRQHLF